MHEYKLHMQKCWLSQNMHSFWNTAMATCPQRREELNELCSELETWWMFVVSGCDSDGEGGHLNGQPNALNDHHHHQYQSRANLRQEVRHNDRDGASLGRVSDAMLAHLWQVESCWAG